MLLLLSNYFHLEASLAPLPSRPGGVMAKGLPKVMKSGSCSATTVAGSAALPFVISTGAQRSGEICVFSGLFLEMCFRQGPVPQLQLQEAPPSPLSSRPERSVVERSAFSAVSSWKCFSTRSCSATTVAGSAALPFVISTGAQRSGEICGVSGPFLEMFFDRRSHGPKAHPR